MSMSGRSLMSYVLIAIESSFARFEATSGVEVKDVPDIFKGTVLSPARPLPAKVFPLSNNRTALLAIRDEIERRTTFLAGEFGIVPYPIGIIIISRSLSFLSLH
jgi:hypothetical protein